MRAKNKTKNVIFVNPDNHFPVSEGKFNKSDAVSDTDVILKNILWGTRANNISKSTNYTEKALCNGVYSDDTNQNRSHYADLANSVG